MHTLVLSIPSRRLGFTLYFIGHHPTTGLSTVLTFERPTVSFKSTLIIIIITIENMVYPNKTCAISRVAKLIITINKPASGLNCPPFLHRKTRGNKSNGITQQAAGGACINVNKRNAEGKTYYFVDESVPLTAQEWEENKTKQIKSKPQMGRLVTLYINPPVRCTLCAVGKPEEDYTEGWKISWYPACMKHSLSATSLGNLCLSPTLPFCPALQLHPHCKSC